MERDRLYGRDFFVAFICQAGFVVANTLMAHYARWITFLGGTLSDVGWIIGAGSFGGLMLRVWVGQWIDRFGAIKVWLAGSLLFAAAATGNVMLQELSLKIYFLQMSTVGGAAMIAASSLTYITQIAPAGRETEAIGILGVGGFAGMFAGPYLGDVILGSGEFTRSDFENLFYSAIGIILLSTPLLLLINRTSLPRRAEPVRGRVLRQSLRDYWPGSILLVNMSFGVALTVPLVFLARFIDDSHLQLSWMSEIGVFFLCYCVLGASIRVFFRSLPERFGRRKVLIAGVFVMACGMLSFLWVDENSAGLLAVSGLLCGAGHSFMFHTGLSLAIESFPREYRGTGATLSLMVQDFGTIAWAPILGLLAENHGYNCLFAVIALVCVAVGIIYTIACVRQRKASRAG